MFLKKKPHRNPIYLAFIRTLPCATTEASSDWANIVAHHVRTGNNPVTGRKVSDYYTIPLTWEEHGKLHSGSERKYYESNQINTNIDICMNLILYMEYKRLAFPERDETMDHKEYREILIELIEEKRVKRSKRVK